MKFAAVLALAAGAMAMKNETVTYVTEVVTAVTTFCPGPTEVTYGGSTYTVTEATTLTITDCPSGCTIKVPVTTVSSVVCNNNCNPVYHNSTTTRGSTATSIYTSVGTVTPVPSATKTGKTPIETAGAGRAAALSGGALAGLLGLAAFVL
jgi:hypothetical protein